MNINLPVQDKECIVSDEMLMGLYAEVLDTIRQDRLEVSETLNNFCDMVFNEGDGSSASKEALVQLIKIKTDLPDKVIKIADLMTRLKMKDANTYKPYLNAKQENNFNINDDSMKKEMLRILNSAKKKQAKEGK